eukprot:COSAG04_NODE_2896_length_3406_cov_1.773208_3_plen_153_part_00
MATTALLAAASLLGGAAAGVAGAHRRGPPPPPGPPLAPSSRDADWQQPFARADMLYDAGPRPDFERLNPIENCTARGCGPNGCDGKSNCSALWWPGLGNGFLGGIAQGPTLRIAGLFSGDYGARAHRPSRPPRLPVMSGVGEQVGTPRTKAT